MAIKPGAIKPVITPASQPLIAKKTAPAASPAGGKKPELTVSSNTKKNDLGVQTLVGDYEHVGMNHGKKYFKKVQDIPGHANIKVFLYYWDNRDGAESSGWWFGDQVGGTEVWARAVSSSATPPVAGWKVPWNALKPEPGLLTVSPFKGAAPAATTPAATTPAKTEAPKATAAAGSDPRVKKATAQINVVETQTNAAVTKAKAISKDSALEAMKQTQETLQKQVDKLSEAQKSLTQEIVEARKAGPTGIASVTELSKLSPKIRTASNSVTAELNRIKGLVATAKTPEELAKIAEKEKKDYEEALPSIKTAVDDASEAVETVSTLAAPLIADPPEDPGSALTEIDSAATSAQTKVHEVRQKITTKLAAAKNFTSADVKKEAVSEYTSLQNKLIEEQKKLDPLKTLKRDFAKRIEAKKALAEISEKLADAELEAEKASMMTAGAGSGSQMSEEDVKSGEDLVTKARNALSKVMGLIDAKLKGASGPMKDELSSMRNKLADSTGKVNKIGTVLKSQREGLALQSVYSTAHEKVDKAEEAFAKCGDAELPFLKGIEVLPQEESDKAIKESETAAAESQKLLHDAKTYLSQKAQEIRKYSKATQDTANEELKELNTKVEEISKKLGAFKKDTQERKVAAIMAEAVDSVIAAESKAKPLNDAGAPLAASSLDEKSVEELKEAMEKATAAEKACTEAVNEAKKVCSAKQKSAKSPDIQAALQKLMNRLNAVQNDIVKVQKYVATGEKVVKGKELSVELDTKLTASEEEIDALVKQANPEDDGLGVETVSDAAVLEIDGKITTLAKELKPMQTKISAFLTGAPAASKASFSKLSERCKTCLTKVEEVKTKTKAQREKVLAVSYVKECTDKTVETEATLEKLAEAEAPYLKGVEVLPLEQSISSLKACDEAAAAVQSAISASKQFITAKQMELKKFDAAVGKSALDDITKLTGRLATASQNLSQFKKDTEGRKKTAALQEAGEKVKAAEAEVVKVSDYIKPLSEKDPDALSPEESTAIVKSLEELEEKALACISETKAFCNLRMKEAAGDKEKMDQVKELLAKLSEQSSELSKAKKAGSTFIDKIKGKALAQEAADKLKEAEAEVAKATAACAPLLEEKGLRFLVKQSLATMATALRTHMQEKDISFEAMHKEIGQTQSAFVSFVAKMPEAFGREECSFSEERREAMFKSADADADGTFSADDFKAMLSQRYLCITPVTVTDVFDIGTSKTVCKLEKGALLIATGVSKKPEGEGGMPRLQCKVAESGEEGWVTVQGSSGTKFLELKTPFSEWMKELESTLAAHTTNLAKISNFFKQKAQMLASAGKDTPLAATRETLKEIGLKVTALETANRETKSQLAKAKSDYFTLERKEKNAHIEAKEQKEADEILSVAKPAVDAMEGEFKKLEEVSKSLLEKVATPDLLQEFATPLTVFNEAQSHEKLLKTLAGDAKEVVKKQADLEAIKKATKGPVHEAKNELQKWLGATSKLVGNASKIMASMKSACNQISIAKSQAVASALRAGLSGTTAEDCFAKLAAGGDAITEEAFCKHIRGLSGVSLSEEQAKLVATHIDADGVSRRSFLRLVQQYMKVVQGIAITPNFEVVDTKEKMVRKAEVEEMVEVLEGPVKDEKSGLERVRVKAVVDGAVGWISVKGNQGKQFLEQVDKPFFTCVKDTPMEKEFKSSSEALVRTLKAEEVVELVEGPRAEVLGNATRAKVKASSDSKIGWVTVKDQTGSELVEKNGTIYTCVSTVAITDNFDIGSCKVLRKMMANEVFTMSEGPVNEDSSGITRVKGKSSKDGIEGWITITGNAGTVFAKLNEKLYTVKREVTMQKAFQSDSEDVRKLEAEEALEVLEGPKEEKFQPVERMKVRASDGALGWITHKSANSSVKKWSPTYKVVKHTSLYTTKGMKEAVVREVAQAEVMNMLEGPVEVDGAMWVKGRMKKDGAVGWGLIKDESGARLWGQ